MNTASTTKRAAVQPPSIGGFARWRAVIDTLPVVAGVGLLIPLFTGSSILYLFTTAVIYALFAMSTNVLFGWTGMSSFGQAAFFGVGGYTVGLLHEQGLPSIVLVLAGAIVALVAAVVFGVAAVRTTGVQFAMLTLVFAQVLYLLTYRIDALGGENGLPGISRGSFLGVDLGDQTAFWWYVIVIVGMAILVLRRIRLSSLGAAFTAVRDDPVRAAALGIRVRVVRIAAFAIAGALGGLAGSLYGLQQGLVSPSMLFWALSGNVIVMCLLGGLHHFWGPAVGAVGFTILNWFFFNRMDSPSLYVGLVFLLVVVFLPGGIASLAKQAINAVRVRRR